MKTDKNILIAFVLNLAFAIFEFVGGAFTNSVAIMSDAIHDIGDALSIGVSYLLEKKSKGKPNDDYTYGYARYSVIGSVFTTMVLLTGSCFVLYNAVRRLLSPEEINYNGMLVFAIIGVTVNLAAAWATRRGDSLNQKAVNLHMLEDVLGWIGVLIGSVVMKFTDFWLIDPLMSIIIASWILFNAGKTMVGAIRLLADKSPIQIESVINSVKSIDGVIDVHHVHVWSMDGKSNCATMHVLVKANHAEIKKKIRDALNEIGIAHTTLELESKWEHCGNKQCGVETDTHVGCACHGHH